MSVPSDGAAGAQEAFWFLPTKNTLDARPR